MLIAEKTGRRVYGNSLYYLYNFSANLHIHIYTHMHTHEQEIYSATRA